MLRLVHACCRGSDHRGGQKHFTPRNEDFGRHSRGDINISCVTVSFFEIVKLIQKREIISLGVVNHQSLKIQWWANAFSLCIRRSKTNRKLCRSFDGIDESGKNNKFGERDTNSVRFCLLSPREFSSR